MFSFTESVTITASPSVIWTHLVDLQRWWTASHPDHVRLEILSPDRRVAEGARIDFEEQIAGVKMIASGSIVSMHEDSEATWEGAVIYHRGIFKISVHEGMKWRIAAMSGLAIVSASVWTEFPANMKGRLIERHTTRGLQLPEAYREHTRRKLNYLKELIEKARPQ